MKILYNKDHPYKLFKVGDWVEQVNTEERYKIEGFSKCFFSKQDTEDCRNKCPNDRILIKINGEGYMGTHHYCLQLPNERGICWKVIKKSKKWRKK